LVINSHGVDAYVLFAAAAAVAFYLHSSATWILQSCILDVPDAHALLKRFLGPRIM
jgi:hypothetical protein